MSKQNYTEEQEAILYNEWPTTENKEAYLATKMAEWGKTKRSLVAKLVKMQMYEAKARVSKITGGEPRTKEMLVREIEVVMGEHDMMLDGLEKAPKLVLVKILKALQ